MLRQIGAEAVAPFFDPRLPTRISHARREWIARATAALNADPAYIDAREAVETQRTQAESVITAAIAEAKPAIAEAIEGIQPVIEEAVGKVRPLIEEAVTEANQAISNAMASISAAQAKAIQAMESVEIEMPEFDTPEPDLPPTPEPLWSTDMSDIEATRKLLEHKLMVGDDPDEEEEDGSD